jgi:hypothetical protein
MLYKETFNKQKTKQKNNVYEETKKQIVERDTG